MAYLTVEQLKKMGFKKLGKNLQISDKVSIYNADQIEIGDHSRIDDFCVISGKVTIGNNVHITIFCNIAGGIEGITIEDFCTIAYGSHVFSQSDDYTGLALTGSTVPTEYKKDKKSKVHLGRHCIVGANSLVLPGVTMAEGCSLGAASMLTKSTEPWSIYVGSPAKKIKDRKKDLLELEKAYLSSESS